MRRGDITAADGVEIRARQVVAIDLGDAQLTEVVQTGLQACEDRLIREMGQGADFLVDMVSHLAVAGGKRFRPMFSLLAARFGTSPDADVVVTAATVVELTHLATLYHDDVMDEATMRRGVDSANARWGNSLAILSGDYLFAVASRLLAGLGSASVEEFAITFGKLVTGQMRETMGPQPGEDPIGHYMDVIHEKTGVLIATAGRLGAMHAGASAEHVDALGRYGDAVGIIFQIVDDIIDIFSDAEQSGKTPGTDLREGVFTLPVLYALQEEGPVGDRLRELLVGPVTRDADVAEALDLLARSQGRQRALADVHSWLDIAREQLGRLPDIPARNALWRLAEYSAERVG